MENYCEMCLQTTTGCFSSDTVREYVPYIRLQGHANQANCKGLHLKNGLSLATDKVFEIYQVYRCAGQQLVCGMPGHWSCGIG